MPSLYKGPERRSNQDHDTLIVMVQLLQNHVENFDNHRASYKDHILEDKKQFESIGDKLQKLINYKYLVIGGFIVIQVMFKIFWKA